MPHLSGQVRPLAPRPSCLPWYQHVCGFEECWEVSKPLLVHGALSQCFRGARLVEGHGVTFLSWSSSSASQGNRAKERERGFG